MGAILVSNINQIFSTAVVDQIIKFGAKHFFISPGLRNAPLISAISRFPDAKIYTEIDERSASYRALGVSKEENVPGVLICTSGTALYNYAPALAEAYKTNTSIIVISADRPLELINKNTNQTVNQQNAFISLGIEGHHMECPSNSTPLFDSIKNLSFYLNNRIKRLSLPAHINIPFREPLDDTYQEIPTSYEDELSLLLNYKFPVYSEVDKISSSDMKKPLVIIGDLPKSLAMQVGEFLSTTKILNICDITSGLKLYLNNSNLCLPSIDHPEVEEFIHNYQPECVIQIGNRLISKKYEDIFKGNKNIKWYHISNFTLNAPTAVPTIRVNASPVNVLRSLKTDKVEGLDFIESINLSKRSIINNSTKPNIAFFSKSFLDTVDQEQIVFIGNSSIIRSFDYYINCDETKKFLSVKSNRGVSGIEGNIATVKGICDASPGINVTAVIGDISFLHDISSLKSFSESSDRVKIYVLNDNSGGIFNLLPLELNDSARNIITSPHSYNFKQACEQFQISYQQIETKKELLNSYKDRVNSPTLYEVTIDPSETFSVYQKLKTMR